MFEAADFIAYACKGGVGNNVSYAFDVTNIGVTRHTNKQVYRRKIKHGTSCFLEASGHTLLILELSLGVRRNEKNEVIRQTMEPFTPLFMSSETVNRRLSFRRSLCDLAIVSIRLLEWITTNPQSVETVSFLSTAKRVHKSRGKEHGNCENIRAKESNSQSPSLQNRQRSTSKMTIFGNKHHHPSTSSNLTQSPSFGFDVIPPATSGSPGSASTLPSSNLLSKLPTQAASKQANSACAKR